MAYKITKMKRINFEYFLWRTEVTLKQTKQFNHIYTQRSLISLCLVVQVFTVLRYRSDKDFCLGTGNRRTDMNLENMKNTWTYYHSLSSLKIFVKSMQPSLRKSADKKKGGGGNTRNTKERKKTTTITLRSSVENGSS